MNEAIKPAFLFPGQGSQTVGMGRELYENFPAAKAIFKQADEALGFHLSHLIFEGPTEALQQTEHTQPAILTVSIAAWTVLLEALPDLKPCFAAGHSLGEYSAHVAAGTLSFAEAVRTVRARGRFMQQAVPSGQGAMAAILGLPSDQITELCARATDELRAEFERLEATPPDAVSLDEIDSEVHRDIVNESTVSPANLNSPDQTVISGSTAGVHRAIDLCKEAGAKRTVLLAVSAPFHCALMAPAQKSLMIELEGVRFQDPGIHIASNVDARFATRDSDARDTLIRQVTGPVRWVECIQLLMTEAPTHFIEVGPGKVLSGLNRQILGRDAAIPTLNVEDPASLEKTLAALASA